MAQKRDVEILRKRARILVIDDQKDAFPVEAMKSRGYNIDHWSDITLEGLGRLEQGQYDVLILDIRGVGKSISFEEGFGVLKRLKQVRPDLRIVAFSGATFDIAESRFFDLADDVLQKPVDIFACEEKLNELLCHALDFDELWKGVDHLLAEARVGQWRRRRLRVKVEKAIKKGGNPEGVKKKIAALIPDRENTQLAVQIISLLFRLYEITRGGGT